MAKIILTTKVTPTYDDIRECQYHLPRTYKNQIEQAVGDEFIYYEPRRQDDDPGGRLGRQSYIATGRITRVREDPVRPDHFYADVSDYIDFDQPVPFREGTQYYESALIREDGGTNRGAFGRAARILPDRAGPGL